MFRRLAHNTAISAAAFFLISVVGLLLTPLLVKAYGLAGFGLIVLARLLLPTGALALIDFGVSEVAIQATARARETRVWASARGQLTLLASGATAIGIIAGLLIFVARFPLAVLVKAPAEHMEAFSMVVGWTGVALPLIFLSLSAEGVLKGYERYGTVRSLEVSSTLIYAGGAAIAALKGLSFAWPCYVYLAAQVFRSGSAVLLAWSVLAADHIAPSRWTRQDRKEVVSRCAQLGYGRILGSIQGQAPAFFIATLWGASAAGVYDVLTRLPKVAKSVLGLINSTLLPVAIRLDAAENHQKIRVMGETGVLLIILLTMPVLSACMLFSGEILQFWIGPEVSGEWIWHAMMFVIPCTAAIVGFGSNALLGRQEVVKKLNGIVTLQVAIQVAISFGATFVLQDKSFILGQVIAAMIGLPLSLRTIRTAQNLSVRPVLWIVRAAATLGAMAAGWAILLPRPHSLFGLVIEAGIWTLITTIVLLAILPNTAERNLLKRIVSIFLPSRLGTTS